MGGVGGRGPDRLPCRAQAKLDWAGLRQFVKEIKLLGFSLTDDLK